MVQRIICLYDDFMVYDFLVNISLHKKMFFKSIYLIGDSFTQQLGEEEWLPINEQQKQATCFHV